MAVMVLVGILRHHATRLLNTRPKVKRVLTICEGRLQAAARKLCADARQILARNSFSASCRLRDQKAFPRASIQRRFVSEEQEYQREFKSNVGLIN
jgi:tRNA(Ser,Leu) C12 N-acetylase TAN1